MAEELHDDGSRPAIHVSVVAGLDDAFFNWAAFGAEEEGVPCRPVPSTQTDPVAMAYDAAISSRFGVGIGISAQRVVVHELHMPADHPVVTFEATDKVLEFCRLAGSNAARLIVRLPLRFALEAPPVIQPKSKNTRQQPAPGNTATPSPEFDPAMIKAIAKVVAQIVQKRGIV